MVEEVSIVTPTGNAKVPRWVADQLEGCKHHIDALTIENGILKDETAHALRQMGLPEEDQEVGPAVFYLRMVRSGNHYDADEGVWHKPGEEPGLIQKLREQIKKLEMEKGDAEERERIIAKDVRFQILAQIRDLPAGKYYPGEILEELRQRR